MVLKTITAFIGSLGGGGAQGVFVTVMNYYVSLGYKINAVINTMSNDVYSNELDKSVKITNLSVQSAKESLPKIIKYIKSNEVELAFAFSPEITVNVIIGRMLSGKKFLVIGRCINTLSFEYRYADGTFRRLITNSLIKKYYHKADMVIAQAERMREDLITNFHFRDHNVVTINNPLGDKFSREIDNPALEDRDDYILYVGRFEKQKGLFMLIDSFAAISNKSIKLLIIGKGSQEHELMEKINNLDLSNRVEIQPFTKEIENYYKKAKLVVMSSYFEGFPNVLSEAIACGTPIVSFDLPSGPSDIVINGENGYLAEYLNVEDMAKKIDLALMKRWNYTRVKKTAGRFKKENILPKYRDLIENMEII